MRRKRLLQGALIKPGCTEKLVEIGAEEKNPVEIQEVTGYHLGREDSRGRKQKGGPAERKGVWLREVSWDKQGLRS